MSMTYRLSLNHNNILQHNSCVNIVGNDLLDLAGINDKTKQGILETLKYNSASGHEIDISETVTLKNYFVNCPKSDC